MDEQLEQILRQNGGWMDAHKIARVGGWRSAVHVALCLRPMEAAGRIVSRADTDADGTPTTEWRIAYPAATKKTRKPRNPATESAQ